MTAPDQPRTQRDQSLTTTAQVSVPRAALPVPMTTFVGRAREVAEVRALLARPDVRLLTLTGPGGAGKTRLALEAARAVSRDIGPAWFVLLAAIHDPALVPAAIARGLGLSQGATVPELGDLLRGHRGLLLLDSFEQVIAARDLVAHLVESNPAITVVVTSRAALHLPAEHVFEVPPLDVPGDDDPTPFDTYLASDGVQLLVARARDRGVNLTITDNTARILGAICRRLDGLPLAIELVAARLRILPPRILLERLEHRLPLLEGGPRDAPARQRTMRETIAWSYVLLEPAEQSMLLRLAVFAGSFEADAIGPVTGIGEDAITRLGSLVDHNLVRRLSPSLGGTPDAPRYFLFATIREFGLERLQENDELDAARERHATWCLDVARTASRGRTDPAASQLGVDLKAERHNLRAALEWLGDSERSPEAMELAATLWPLWLELGEIADGRRHLSRLLETRDDSTDAAIRAHAQQVLGMLCQAQGDHADAQALSHAALSVFDALGDDRGAGAALTTLGLVSMVQGDDVAATRFLERSLDRFRTANDLRAGSWALRHLSSVAYRRGDIDAYESLARQGLEIVLPTGHPLDLARLRSSLALAATIRGNLDDAAARYEEVLALYRQADDRWGEADASHRLGHVAFLRGQDELAEELFDRSAALLRYIGDPEGTARVHGGKAWLARRRGHPDLAAQHFAAALDIARHHAIRRTEAKALLGEGVLALDNQDLAVAAARMDESLTIMSELGDSLALLTTLEWIVHLATPHTALTAARLAGACAALRAQAGIPVMASAGPEHELLLQELRSRHGGQAFERAVATGRSNALDQAMADARDIIARAKEEESRAECHGEVSATAPATGILTPRQIDVIRLLAQGCTDQEIADRLSISRRTATTHVANIFTKLGISSRTAAAAYAARHGIDPRD